MTIKSYIVIDGFNIADAADYGIYAYSTKHITISNNTISGSGDTVFGFGRSGIYIDNTTDSLINGNTIYHNSSDGIVMLNSSNNTISNNLSYANSSHYDDHAVGINLYYSTYNTVIHNTTYANDDSGISCFGGSSYNKVIGNVSYGNGDHGIDNNASPYNIIIGNTVQGNVTVGIDLEGSPVGSGGATIMNNVMVDNGLLHLVGGGTYPHSPGNLRLDSNSISGTTLDYNLYYLSSANGGTVQIVFEPTQYTSLASFRTAYPTQEVHGIQGDPHLVAPAPPAARQPAAPYSMAENLGDNHITVGSLAIDSANAGLADEPILDRDGFPRVDDPGTPNTGAGTRTYDDRGAYEFQPVCYVLTINPGVNGATPVANPTKSPSCTNIGEYNAGQVIQLTAASNTGYQVASWTGTDNDASTSTTSTVTMPASARTVGVNYAPISYLLTVVKSGNGSGTVTSNPAGIDCGLTCSFSYVYPTSVNLTATAALGTTFTGWSGDGTGTGVRTVAMTGPKTVTATFTLTEYNLNITSLHGTVTKNPSKTTYHYGEVVQLTATADPGWTFANWSGDVTSTTNPVSITIDGDKSVTANYTQDEYTLTVTSLHGTVAVSPLQATYHYGDVVQLTATADPGWAFTTWSGGATGSANPVSITINGNTSVTANYAVAEYTLTITSLHGTVTKNPDKLTYHYGDVVQLTATAELGWTFANWSGGATGSTNPVSITVNSSLSVTANYTQNEYSLTITSLHGTVAKNPAKTTYHYGDVVQLTATASPGWTFANWTGDVSGTTNPVSITINGNTSVTANYTQDEYTLTITSLHGTVKITPNKATYHYGDVVQLVAQPDRNWAFSIWTGDVTGSGRVISITITGNMSVTANYVQHLIYFPIISDRPE